MTPAPINTYSRMSNQYFVPYFPCYAGDVGSYSDVNNSNQTVNANNKQEPATTEYGTAKGDSDFTKLHGASHGDNQSVRSYTPPVKKRCLQNTLSNSASPPVPRESVVAGNETYKDSGEANDRNDSEQKSDNQTKEQSVPDTTNVNPWSSLLHWGRNNTNIHL
ncbi:unnamed protein product [Calicophoron daubneyi]|uniref:Uncharacterized protein n=1 Tax=Calicophoron daubneyi TaxID=300641 RepID=A0AAV2T3C7_CALDB